MNFERIDNIITKPVRFNPLGHCMYCGTADGELTDEHILPYGLARNSLILPDSSCTDCNKITCKVENDVLRKQMIEMRTALKAPVRKKKKRPTQFELYQAFSEDGSFLAATGNSTTVLSDDFPWRFHALRMDQAGFLLGHPKFQPLYWEHWSTGRVPDPIPAGENRTVATRTGQINPYTFARFLAKVGHSYAYAYHGRSFEPMLLDLINGKTDGAFRYWIGSDLAVQPAEPGRLHHVSLQTVARGGSDYLIAIIHLFRMLGTPVYHAVVGKVR